MRKPLLGAALILALAGFFYLFTPNLANRFLYVIARPVWSTERYLSQKLGVLWTSLQGSKRLAIQNAILEQQLEEAGVALQTLDAYKNENEDLKNMLNRTDTSKHVLSAVLRAPGRSLYDTLILDTGEKQGVSVGDKVMSGDFVIGSVRAVYADYSKATLLSSPGETLAVTIGESRVETKALGRGGGNFIARLPKEMAIKKGDSVRLPGLSVRLLGTVEDIETTVTGSFQSILFRLPQNPNELRFVEIVRD